MVTELEPAGVLQTVPIAAGQQSHSGQAGGAQAYLPSTVLTSDGDKAGASRRFANRPDCSRVGRPGQGDSARCGGNRGLNSLGLG